jgi:hypothetical protein
METDGFWSFAGTIFWIILVITLLSIILDVYVTTSAETLTSSSQQASAAQADQCLWFIKAITISLEKFANILFWYLVAMSAWWFVFFKFQARLSVLMPDLPD